MSRGAFLLMVCGLVLGVATPARCDTTLDQAVERYVCDRDLAALRTALKQSGRQPGDALYDLAFLSEEAVESPAADAVAEGLQAVVLGVRALRASDLHRARRLSPEAEHSGGIAGAWLAALVMARSGDATGAQARLMAPPIFSGTQDALHLALLGEALVEEDRWMLIATARDAVARAAQRDRLAVLEHLGMSAAALDSVLGLDVLARCVRALRRLGDAAAARDALARVTACGLGLDVPALALEAALLAWVEGEPARAASVLRGVVPAPGTQDLFLLLSRAHGVSRTPLALPPLAHATGPARSTELVLRLCSQLGIPATREEVEAQGQDPAAVDPGHPARVRAFFEARGCHVLAVGGDARGTDALLAAQIPFLLYRIARDGPGYADLPLLVRGFDRDTGLWRVDEPDVARLDALPRSYAAKSWSLLVVPVARAALLEPMRGTESERLGAAVETLRLQASGATPTPTPGAAGSLPLLALYKAYGIYQRARLEANDHLLREAAASVEISRRAPPLMGFEEFVRAQELAVAGDHAAALAAYDRCTELEGLSADLALARYAGLSRHGRDHAQAARDALVEALRRAPDDLRALRARAVLRRAQGDLPRARSDLMRARELQPDSIELAILLCELSLEAGDPEAALAVLDDIRRQGPDAADNEALRSWRRRVEAERLAQASGVEELRGHRRSREPQTRQRLAYELADRTDEGAEIVLRKLLEDPSPEVRITVLRLYLRPRLREVARSDEVLLRRFTEVLARDTQPSVRGAAAALLARIERPLASEALAQAATGDPAPYVREEALEGLGLVDRPASRTALVAGLKDPELSVRRVAIEGLFRIASTRHGYDPQGSEAERAEATQRWAQWLAGED